MMGPTKTSPLEEVPRKEQTLNLPLFSVQDVLAAAKDSAQCLELVAQADWTALATSSDSKCPPSREGPPESAKKILLEDVLMPAPHPHTTEDDVLWQPDVLELLKNVSSERLQSVDYRLQQRPDSEDVESGQGSSKQEENQEVFGENNQKDPLDLQSELVDADRFQISILLYLQSSVAHPHRKIRIASLLLQSELYSEPGFARLERFLNNRLLRFGNKDFFLKRSSSPAEVGSGPARGRRSSVSGAASSLAAKEYSRWTEIFFRQKANNRNHSGGFSATAKSVADVLSPRSQVEVGTKTLEWRTVNASFGRCLPVISPVVAHLGKTGSTIRRQSVISSAGGLPQTSEDDSAAFGRDEEGHSGVSSAYSGPYLSGAGISDVGATGISSMMSAPELVGSLFAAEDDRGRAEGEGGAPAKDEETQLWEGVFPSPRKWRERAHGVDFEVWVCCLSSALLIQDPAFSRASLLAGLDVDFAVLCFPHILLRHPKQWSFILIRLLEYWQENASPPASEASSSPSSTKGGLLVEVTGLVLSAFAKIRRVEESRYTKRGDVGTTGRLESYRYSDTGVTASLML